MPTIKLSSLDGSNAQEIKTGQLEITVENPARAFVEVTWNDRGVRKTVLTDPLGVKVAVVS